ncbi:MAG TPA: FHA domain-containing protein [Actinomycetes bacterium]|nr:FHA domain-containing protein [Actinomycetes bacterium]
MPVCPHCGHDTSDADARFCPACGRSLTDTPAVDATSSLNLGSTPREGDDADADSSLVDTAVIDRLQPGSALLVVKRGPSSGARFLLDADVTTVGRHPDSHIFLDDVTVSRRHAEFRRDAGSYRVHDSGSLNGTYVNRSRIDDARLANHDEVQIGKYRLVFFSGPSAAAAEGAQ